MRRTPASGSDWKKDVKRCMAEAPRPLHLVGVGNPLRRDDAAGIEVLSSIKRSLRGSRLGRLKIHPPSLSPERALSSVPASEGLLIFDAVEAGVPPGGVVCAPVTSTDYGYFATHNLPLRLVPGVAGRDGGAFIIGIEPESVEFGEGLTATVKASVEAVSALVAREAVDTLG